MCGIIGYIGTEPAWGKIVRSLKQLEYRGYDSAGIAIVRHPGDIVVHKNVGDVGTVFEGVKPVAGTCAIGHTRWATHGGVTQRNAHPHTDCKGNIAVVHNGIIDNYRQLRASMPHHTFVSETDTEIIPHLIEDTHRPLLDAMFTISELLTGQFAIVAVDMYGNMVAMRRGNPLVIGLSAHGMYVTSDQIALPENVKSIVYVNDDELVTLSPQSYKLYSLIDKALITREPEPFTASDVISTTGCRMDYEMREQPDVIRNICRHDRNLYTDIAFDIAKSREVVFVGCGTSKHAALVGRYAIHSIAHKPADVIQASEFEYLAEPYGRSTLMIALSQSGETSDVLRAVQVAHQHGAKVLSLVNNPMSSLARSSDYVLPLCCGPEVSVASTKAFTAQLCIMYLLSYAMQNRFDKGVSELLSVADAVKQEVSNYQATQELADVLKTHEHMYYIGRGINYPLACEGALKMKEIAYIQAESFPAGELKHGPLALIEKGTPVLGVVPDDDTYTDTLANLHEAKARGATIIGVSDKPSELFDYLIPIPAVNKIFYPIVTAVPLHVLSYLVSVSKGINPDRPRNLAKSVTVR
jgi:glucosamine--fructose-6-phosphate aminotransferase (isomerizing)